MCIRDRPTAVTATRSAALSREHLQLPRLEAITCPVQMLCTGEAGAFNPVLRDCLREIENEIDDAMRRRPRCVEETGACQMESCTNPHRTRTMKEFWRWPVSYTHLRHYISGKSTYTHFSASKDGSRKPNDQRCQYCKGRIA